MIQKRKPYQVYTKEFKQEAVRLMEKSNRPPTEIAINNWGASNNKLKILESKYGGFTSFIFPLTPIFLVEKSKSAESK